MFPNHNGMKSQIKITGKFKVFTNIWKSSNILPHDQ